MKERERKKVENKFKGFPLDKQAWDFPVVVDNWVYVLTGGEFKILWYIIRHTYGAQKTMEIISYKQFCEGIQREDGTWLNKGPGLSKQSISDALKKLRVYGFIERIHSRNSRKIGYYLKLATSGGGRVG